MFYKNSYSLTAPTLTTKLSEKAEFYKTTEEELQTVSTEIDEEPEVKRNPLLGFFYTFVYSTTFGLSSVIMKELSYITPGQITFIRNAGAFAGCLPVAIYYVKSIIGEKKDRTLLVMRGFLGTTALYLNVMAYIFLPLADVAVLLSVIPVMTVVLAHFMLKETIGIVQIFCLVISLCGVLIAIRLPELLNDRSEFVFDTNYIAGLASALGCIITLSFTYVTLRKMQHVHFSVIMLYFGVLGMIENIIINGASTSYDPLRCGWDTLLYLALGLLAVVTNSCITLAVQVEEVAIISVVRSSLDIIVAIAFQVFFFGEIPDLYNIFGGLLVIVSVSILGIRKWLQRTPEESKARKRLRYFLL